MNKNLGNFINGTGSYSDPYIIEILNKKNNRHIFYDVHYELKEKENLQNFNIFHTIKKKIEKVGIGIIYLLFFLMVFVIIPSVMFIIWG